MRWGIVISLLLLTILAKPALADAITFSLNQSDYYFTVGQEAIVSLESNNSYGQQIDGMLSYTISQQQNQQNSQYTSTNTNSASFSVPDGNKTIMLNFGSSQSPGDMSVSLRFDYDKNGQKTVSIGSVTIHFVKDPSQQQQSQQNQQQNSQPSPSPNQEQQSQDQIQQTQQKLQNNQMNQDTSALKNQIQKQLSQDDKVKQEFQKSIQSNPDFQNMHNDLLQKGYQVSDASLNPESNDTGSFKIDYQSSDGRNATIDGTMKNGTMQLSEQSSEDMKRMMDQLANSTDFKKFSEQLAKEGFNATNKTFEKSGNDTVAKFNYTSNDNRTAMITADFISGNLTDVNLQKQDNFNYSLLLLAAIPCALAYLIYRRYSKKTKIDRSNAEFDHKKESMKLLDQARKLFDEKRYKDAYGKAAQSLRLYLSHEYGLRKEMTSHEIVMFLKSSKKDYEYAKECFDLCSLVEFAKYEANEKDFGRITSIVMEYIG